MSKEEIERLQQLQKKRLENKKLSELSDEDQIEFCRTNKKIGELAYQMYRRTKHDPACALEAASYFLIAYDHVVQRATNEFQLAVLNHHEKISIDKIAISQQAEEICLQGYCYLLGIGNYPQNIKMAAQLFEMSAEKGVAEAQRRIGYMYRKGYGVAENDAKAFKWNSLAVNQKLASAQFNLALLYENGSSGVTKNVAKACEWYLLAAEQGNATAQCNLGYFYERDGETQDLAKARQYFLFAAEQGYAIGQSNLGRMYHDRNEMLDFAEARKWYLLAAEQGEKTAQYNLGSLYDKGNGAVATDMRASLRWYRLAAESNDQDAINKFSAKDNVLTKYHAAMLEDDTQTILKLLIEEKSESVIDELRWDIKRAVKKNSLFKQIESILQQLKEKPVDIDMDSLASVLNHEYIKNLLEDHQEKQMNYERYTKEDLKSTYDVLLKNINWSMIKNNQVVPLVKLITDSWIQATEMNCDEIVSDASRYLTILIHQLKTIQLASQDSLALQTGEILLCASVLVRQHFGREYEVVFSTPSFKDLFNLVTYIEKGKSHAEIKEKFKDTVKKVTFNDEVMKNVIVLLKEYFTQYPEKISASPYLFGLNKFFIGIDEKMNNQQEREKIIQDLFNYTSACRSAKKIFHQNLFAEDEVEGREIYYYLKNMKINELKRFFESKKSQRLTESFMMATSSP